MNWMKVGSGLWWGAFRGRWYVINLRRVQVGRGQFRKVYAVRALPPASGGDTVTVGHALTLGGARGLAETWATTQEV